MSRFLTKLLDTEPGGQPSPKAQNWATSPPKMGDQTTTLDDQATSTPDDQTTTIENKYPSRVQRRKKGIRLPISKLEKYETFCFVHKLDFQDAVEMAMDWLVAQGTGRPDGHVLIDRLDETKDDEVLIYYAKMTGNKIKDADRKAREDLRHFSVETIKCGIITSVYRAKAKINSFRYCVGAIEEIAEAGIGDATAYLKYLERQTKKGA